MRCLLFVVEYSSRDLYKLKYLYDILINLVKRYVFYKDIVYDKWFICIFLIIGVIEG